MVLNRAYPVPDVVRWADNASSQMHSLFDISVSMPGFFEVAAVSFEPLYMAAYVIASWASGAVLKNSICASLLLLLAPQVVDILVGLADVLCSEDAKLRQVLLRLTIDAQAKPNTFHIRLYEKCAKSLDDLRYIITEAAPVLILLFNVCDSQVAVCRLLLAGPEGFGNNRWAGAMTSWAYLAVCDCAAFPEQLGGLQRVGPAPV
jgi:hypothetical protein